MNPLHLDCGLWAHAADCFAFAALIFARVLMKLLLNVLVCRCVWLWRAIGFVAPSHKCATELSTLLDLLAAEVRITERVEQAASAKIEACKTQLKPQQARGE
jgi:hypothetical protein